MIEYDIGPIRNIFERFGNRITDQILQSKPQCNQTYSIMTCYCNGYNLIFMINTSNINFTQETL